MKKGRHRRFEEARSLKRSVATAGQRCAECGADPEDGHAAWCLVPEDELNAILGETDQVGTRDGDDPLGE